MEDGIKYVCNAQYCNAYSVCNVVMYINTYVYVYLTIDRAYEEHILHS